MAALNFKERLFLWLANMVQTETALDNALQTFHLACDKELATMAAYRSMGMDPNAAPKFGWPLMDRQGIHMNMIDKGGGAAKLTLAVVLGAALVVGGTWASLALYKPTSDLRPAVSDSRPPSPEPRPPASDPRASVPKGHDVLLEESSDGGKTWHEIQREHIQP